MTVPGRSAVAMSGPGRNRVTMFYFLFKGKYIFRYSISTTLENYSTIANYTFPLIINIANHATFTWISI
jgi:hypothetical protein